MNKKKITFEVLDRYDEGYTFTGMDLRNQVYWRTNEQLYPATSLRYMRIWRRKNRGVKCINKAKSLYKIGGIE